MIFLNDFFFWKNSVDFWHRKLTLKVWFRHFLTNHNSLQNWFKTIFLEHVDSWAKILLFRTHHLWNSTTDLILIVALGFVFSISIDPEFKFQVDNVRVQYLPSTYNRHWEISQRLIQVHIYVYTNYLNFEINYQLIIEPLLLCTVSVYLLNINIFLITLTLYDMVF